MTKNDQQVLFLLLCKKHSSSIEFSTIMAYSCFKTIDTSTFPWRRTRNFRCREPAVLVWQKTSRSNFESLPSIRAFPDTFRFDNWINIDRVFSSTDPIRSIVDVHQSRFSTRAPVTTSSYIQEAIREHAESCKARCSPTGSSESSQIKPTIGLIASGGN